MNIKNIKSILTIALFVLIITACSLNMEQGIPKTIATIVEDAGEEVIDAGIEHYTGIDPEIDINGNDQD